MGKIICDVCGTSYPETVNHCPICGCCRSVDGYVLSNEGQDNDMKAGSSGYTHVKGGRFSKSNMKKRTAARQQEFQYDESDNVQETEQKGADRGLLIAFIVLLISVVAVICYILVKFLSPETLNPNVNPKPGNNEGDSGSVISTQGAEQSVSCQEIILNTEAIVLDKKDATYQIEVTLTPAETTETISFTSSNPDVATVTDSGLVTAVAAGEASIAVVCGQIEKICVVTCSFQTDAPSIPTVPTVDLPVTPAGFELNRSDFTLFKKGESWTLYSGSIPDSEITWTSSNPKVATVTDGKVTAVSAGRAVITAEYKGSKLTCTVYCSKSVGEYVDPDNTGEGTQEQPTQGNYKLNTDDGRNNDITIYVGDSYRLKLLDANGQSVDAVFTSSNNGVCTVSGGTVTGVAAGKVNITATYNGETHICIVRVRER